MTKLTKVLIIDDDSDILTLVKYCLADDPTIQVRGALSGTEGLELAITFHPDLILLDSMMPELSGEDTFFMLKKIPSMASVPIVFFTARIQQEEILSYFKIGADDVITKPFDPVTLLSTLQKIWENYQKKHAKDL